MDLAYIYGVPPVVPPVPPVLGPPVPPPVSVVGVAGAEVVEPPEELMAANCSITKFEMAKAESVSTSPMTAF